MEFVKEIKTNVPDDLLDKVVNSILNKEDLIDNAIESIILKSKKEYRECKEEITKEIIDRIIKNIDKYDITFNDLRVNLLKNGNNEQSFSFCIDGTELKIEVNISKNKCGYIIIDICEKYKIHILYNNSSDILIDILSSKSILSLGTIECNIDEKMSSMAYFIRKIDRINNYAKGIIELYMLDIIKLLNEISNGIVENKFKIDKRIERMENTTFEDVYQKLKNFNDYLIAYKECGIALNCSNNILSIGVYDINKDIDEEKYTITIDLDEKFVKLLITEELCENEKRINEYTYGIGNALIDLAIYPVELIEVIFNLMGDD